MTSEFSKLVLLFSESSKIASVKTTECPNVFQIPESEDDFLSLVGEIKERVRQLAIDDDQTGPQVSKRLTLPLRFRKAGRVWCGDARESLSHVSQWRGT